MSGNGWCIHTTSSVPPPPSLLSDQSWAPPPPPPNIYRQISGLHQWPRCPPLVARAVMVQKAISSSSKFGWWNSSWRLLKDLHITPDNIGSVTLTDLKDDLQGHYLQWWLQQFSDPNAHPKLCTFRLFKKSIAPSAYLNEGPSYFRPAALHFRCSNHKLDIELGRHNGVPSSDRKCRF